jgi:anti-sigma factor ChrR (cupin superfamily)
VRYAADSQFSEHTHGGGEEFFVLSGTFCDETGEFPAGSYVRNPPGSQHKPFSREGCTIFVKLRQMREDDTQRVVMDTNSGEWQAGAAPGHQVMPLFEGPAERITLEKLDAGASVPAYEAEGGEEIFVLAGSFRDADGSYRKGVWLRNPAGARRRIESDDGCLVWVKRGHLPAG